MVRATAPCYLREAPTGWGEPPAGRGARPLLGRAARGTARGGGAEGGIADSPPRPRAIAMETVGAAREADRGTLASGVDSAYQCRSPFVGARLRCVVLGVGLPLLQLWRDSI